MKPWEYVKAQDDRRWRVWELYGAGLTGPDIAKRLHLSTRTVWRWLAKERRCKPGTAKRIVRKGRPCKLSHNEKDSVQNLLVQNPRVLGLGPGPWTLNRVQKVLFIRFNVIYGNRSILELMLGLGWNLSGKRFFKIRKD